jgi:hypothetical protein
MNKMPKKTINDYTFYKIVCLDNSVELCYVGSTADFNKRRSTHKNVCNNENSKNYNFKIYKTIRENGGWDNFKMIEIGTREQLTKREAEQIEEEYRVELKANMNGHRCFLTDEQKQENRKEYHKEYYQANQEKLNKYQQEYCQANLEKIKEYKQEYRLANSEKIKEKKSEKIVCECGCEISRNNLAKHKLTDKHKQIMENK